MDGYLYIAVFAGAYSAVVTIVTIVLLIRSAVLRVRQERELRFFEISQDKLIGRVAHAECSLDCAKDDAEFYKGEYEELKNRMIKIGVLKEENEDK